MWPFYQSLPSPYDIVTSLATLALALVGLLELLWRLRRRPPSRPSAPGPPSDTMRPDAPLGTDAFWATTLNLLPGYMDRVISARNRPQEEVLKHAVSMVAKALQCHFAFIGFRRTRGVAEFIDVESVGEGFPRNSIPEAFVQFPYPKIEAEGILAELAKQDKPLLLNENSGDVLHTRGVSSAAIAPLQLGPHKAVIAACNRPDDCHAYASRDGVPEQSFGSLDLGLLKCLAWVIERVYEQVVEESGG